MNDIQREIAVDEETFDLSDFKGDQFHDLLLEREQLIADGVKRKYERLKVIDSTLKDMIDDEGKPIVDEDVGSVFYEHGFTTVDWDTKTLLQVLGRLSEELEYKVDPASVKSLLDSGKITEREIEKARIKRPRRGPLTITPLPRSIRDV